LIIHGLGLLIHAEGASTRGNFDIQVTVPDIMPDIPINIEESFYRIAQESLENIVKYADASRVFLCLSIADRVLGLLIEDDGIGFNTSLENKPGTLGIQGMFERAAKCGGNIQLNSTVGQGTIISLSTELQDV